ncbi:hypothetical protein BDA96_03G353000 [Sorghum bicolor]|uniref:Uncharacterized protein n=1 Tax=Sorghum bicolor TaxID=4558 RepID=A0A921RG75_SORBI|nr:hypothetical protein BDA96_03G353000 [Sorghum bicolor]
MHGCWQLENANRLVANPRQRTSRRCRACRGQCQPPGGMEKIYTVATGSRRAGDHFACSPNGVGVGAGRDRPGVSWRHRALDKWPLQPRVQIISRGLSWIAGATNARTILSKESPRSSLDHANICSVLASRR